MDTQHTPDETQGDDDIFFDARIDVDPNDDLYERNPLQPPAPDPDPDPDPDFTDEQPDFNPLTAPTNAPPTPQFNFSLAPDDDDDVFDVIWDTGASHTISGFEGDFVGEITPIAPIMLTGLATGLRVTGKGMIRWELDGNNGKTRTILIPGYFIPGATRRLLCPQQYCQHLEKQGVSNPYGTFNSHQLALYWDLECEIVTYAPNGLPISRGRVHKPVETPEANNVMGANNPNLTDSQKTVLAWHYRLGHISMRLVQWMMRGGYLSRTKTEENAHKRASRCEIPKCSGCEFGKGKRKNTQGNRTSTNEDTQDATKKNAVFAGDRVFVDHFECSQPGRLWNSTGSTSNREMYKGGAIFVDASTGYVHVELQTALTSHATLLSKHRFEAALKVFGITPKTYRLDAHRSFTSRAFDEDLKALRQTSNFAAPGHHGQNGPAERAIGTIMSMARSMMLHSAAHWPDVADASLWPMAVQHATWIYNHTPREHLNGLSPHNMISKTTGNHSELQDLHVWGCPTYVLHPKLAKGDKIPRWDARSRRGMFLGFSPRHSTKVPLILNFQTGYITAQFHCCFDDWFHTVTGDGDHDPDDDVWSQLLTHSCLSVGGPHDDAGNEHERTIPHPGEHWETPANNGTEHNHPAASRRVPPLNHRQTPPPPDSQREQSASRSPSQREHPGTAPPPDSQREQEDTPARSLSSPSDTIYDNPTQAPPEERYEAVPTEPPNPEPPDPAPPPTSPQLRRSTRSTRGQFQQARFHDEDFNVMVGLDWDPTDVELAKCLEFHNVSGNPDIYTYREAMGSDSASAFRKAAIVELQELIARGCWEVVPKSEATHAILPSLWTFVKKRFPDGRLRKHKGRLVAGGHRDPRVFETYSPVIQWTSLRIMMAIGLRKNYKTRCIDCTSAFIQSPLPDDKVTYMAIPQGDFHEIFGPDTSDKCLKLKKSIYGLSFAPKLWVEYCGEKLTKAKFQQSRLDPCLWYRGGIMLGAYVDDIVLFGPTDKELDKALADLAAAGLDFTPGTELEDYLGLDIVRKGDSFEMTQTGLIDKILRETDMENCNPNKIPLHHPVGSCLDEPKHDEAWCYRSIIGKLSYLANTTRPDLSTAVNILAAYSANPKAPHTAAVKSIVRYLKGTRTRGITIQPDPKGSLDCYVDADFAGHYGYEDPLMTDAARSRTGYIILLYGCPVLWKSVRQIQVSIATQEAEYVALSTAAKDVLFLRGLVNEIGTKLHFGSDIKITARSKIFEDNQGALAVAHAPYMTPRSKHYCTRLHFFKQYVKTEDNPSGCLELHHVPTDDNLADIFTKCLGFVKFSTFRQKIMKW